MLFLAGWFGLHGVAYGYEEAPVRDAGTITGKVTLSGEIPPARVFPLVLYPFGPFCKKISDGKGSVVIQEYNVGPKGGFQDTIVSIQNIEKGKPFPPVKSEFIAVDCMFHPADVPEEHLFEMHEGYLRHNHPLVGVMQNDQPLTVINKDPIIHNGQVFQKEKGNIVLNFPLPASMTKPNGGIVHLDKGRRIAQMICGMHEFMQTWAYRVDNPYYARTEKDGLFTIDRLPPGIYKVVAWHPRLEPIEKTVSVPPNGKVEINFEFHAAEVRRPVYESQEKFRAGPEAMPEKGLEGECEPPYCQEEQHDMRHDMDHSEDE